MHLLLWCTLVFKHRKIKDNITDKEWSNIKNSIRKEVVYKAAETIGERSAIDMLDFSDISISDIDTVYVKHRDGKPMALGMKKILPNANIIYIHTEREGLKNENVFIPTLKNSQISENKVKWFADPINARGTTTIEVMRHLNNLVPFEVALISHIAANELGIKSVGSQLTDFNMTGYMNYAFLSKKLNQESGFLEDALKYVRDFGDKLEGTYDKDYKIKYMIEDLKNLLGTSAGDEEILKSIILLLMYGKDIYKNEKVDLASRSWLKSAIKWYGRNRGLKININIDKKVDVFYTIPDKILGDLVKDGFVIQEKTSKKYGKNERKVNNFYLTEEGSELTHLVFIPFLEHAGILRIILRDLDYVVHRNPLQLNKN